MAYKEEQGLPVVPVPGSRTQTHSEERYSLLYHEGSNQRATPFLLSFSRPGPGASPGAGGILLYYLRVANDPMKAVLPAGLLCWVA